jgi:hypothetical protein
MNNATQTTPATDATTATPAAAVPAVPKAPSKKSLALAIFQAKMADRAAGKFALNKDFRAAVLTAIIADLGVSTASAATMYNSAKKDAEAADATVALGRDPKKEKAPSTGKRGRPAGSKNKDKEVAPVSTEAAPVELILPAAEPEVAVDAPASDPVAADAAA